MWWYYLGDPHVQDYSVLGFTLGSPYLRKLPSCDEHIILCSLKGSTLLVEIKARLWLLIIVIIRMTSKMAITVR